MTNIKHAGSLALLTLAAAVACSSGPGPTDAGSTDLGTSRAGEGRQVGVLAFHGDTAQVTVPQTVAVGEPATVVVTTYGGGCIRTGDMEVQVTGLVAELTPYDHFPPAGAICTADLRLNRHTATVQFTQRGRATVRVRGRELPSGRVITAVREITVR
jgi:hypothetical protein